MLLFPGDPLSDSVSTHCGLARERKGQQVLEYSTLRYTPHTNDSVIGQITGRFGDSYRVDIASAIPATLDSLAFHNVNRKNRPQLQVGNIVYARIATMELGMEPELVCFTHDNKEGGYGPLDDTGTAGNDGLSTLLQRVPKHFTQRLLRDDTLKVIGEQCPYEVVVGMNGRIWITAERRLDVIRIVRTLNRLMEVEDAGEVALRAMIKDIFASE